MKTLTIIMTLVTLMFLYSCSTNNVDKEALSTDADTQSATELSGDSVKLVKTARINFKVHDVFESSRIITRTARSMNGFVSNRNLESVEEESKTLRIKDDSLQVITSYVVKAELLVRIPAEKLDAFIEEVSGSASFIQQINVDIDDKSLQYLASDLKQQNTQQFADAMKDNSQQTKENIHLLHPKNLAVDHQIANRAIEADVKYSTVQLNFYQNALIKKETIANNNLAVFKLPFSRSLNNAFFNGWNYFLSFIIGIANLWMFILTILALITGYRYYRLRKVHIQ